MPRLFHIILAVAVSCCAPAYAEQELPLERPADLEPLPEPPDIPPRVESGETLDPEVTIIRGEDATITQYQVNGRLYAMRVQPATGPGYWLVDSDGDGILDAERTPLGSDLAIPSIVIYSW